MLKQGYQAYRANIIGKGKIPRGRRSCLNGRQKSLNITFWYPEYFPTPRLVKPTWRIKSNVLIPKIEQQSESFHNLLPQIPEEALALISSSVQGAHVVANNAPLPEAAKQVIIDGGRCRIRQRHEHGHARRRAHPICSVNSDPGNFASNGADA